MPGEDMAMEKAASLLRIVQDLRVRRITIIGGDPTLWPHLAEFNHLCRAAGCRTTLVTNAMRFGDDRFWEQYIASPSTSAGISIKAHDPESLCQWTGTRAFGKLVTGLRRATEFHRCGVSVVHSRATVGRLADLARFAVDCGARSLGVGLCTPAIREDGIDQAWVPDPRETVADIVSSYPELDSIMHGKVTFAVKLPLCLWPAEFITTLASKRQITTVCQVQKRNGIVFDTDGTILLCNSFFSERLGSHGHEFRDARSLLDTMRSPRVTSRYERATACPSPVCSSCPRYADCAGGCPLYWLAFRPVDVIPDGADSRRAARQ